MILMLFAGFNQERLRSEGNATVNFLDLQATLSAISSWRLTNSHNWIFVKEFTEIQRTLFDCWK